MEDIRRTVAIPIYGGKLIIVITDQPIYDVAKKLFNYDSEDLKISGAVCLEYDDVKGKIYPIIINTESISPGLVAHEAKHIVNHIFRDINASLSANDEEPECYLLQWIVEQIYKIIDIHLIHN